MQAADNDINPFQRAIFGSPPGKQQTVGGTYFNRSSEDSSICNVLWMPRQQQ